MKKNVIDNEKNMLCKIPCWMFGVKIPYCKYILYEDSICIISGIISRSVRSIPLHLIDAKGYYSSAIGRLFGCGCIRLTLRGPKADDAYLYVKHPQEIMDAIENAVYNEKNSFRQKKQSNAPNNKG